MSAKDRTDKFPLRDGGEAYESKSEARRRMSVRLPSLYLDKSAFSKIVAVQLGLHDAIYRVHLLHSFMSSSP